MSNRTDTAVMPLPNLVADEPVRSANDLSMVDAETSVSSTPVEAVPAPTKASEEPGPAEPAPAEIAAVAAAAATPSHAEEGDEWSDLSTKWLVAVGPQNEPHPDADWAASLSAQVDPPAEARGSTPPPPPARRSVPPAPRSSVRETSAYAAAPVAPRAVAEPNPWREEPSYTSSRPALRRERPSWAGSAHAPASTPFNPPPWAATLPPYPAVAWAPHLPPQAAGAWAGALSQTGTQTPVRRNVLESALEQWTSLGNVWLTSVAKLALAAMALQYSGLAEPILARFGYAPAAAQAAQVVAPQGGVGVHAPAMAALASPAPQRLAPQTAALPLPAQPIPEASLHRLTAPPKRTAARVPPTRRAAEPAPAVTPVAAAPVGEATLRINSRPWSQVFVDGSPVGNTPRLNLRVSAGTHRIRLVNPDLALDRTIELSAAAGETISRVELLAE